MEKHYKKTFAIGCPKVRLHLGVFYGRKVAVAGFDGNYFFCFGRLFI
jgi:hypothetical protein